MPSKNSIVKNKTVRKFGRICRCLSAGNPFQVGFTLGAERLWVNYNILATFSPLLGMKNNNPPMGIENNSPSKVVNANSPPLGIKNNNPPWLENKNPLWGAETLVAQLLGGAA